MRDAHTYCAVSRARPLACLVSGAFTSGTPPACCKGRLPIIQALGPKKAGGPSAQWRRQPCDSMFSRSADPLPLERRNDVVSFVSGVACWEEDASRRPSSWRQIFSTIKVFPAMAFWTDVVHETLCFEVVSHT